MGKPRDNYDMLLCYAVITYHAQRENVFHTPTDTCLVVSS
jgi:hypothetical protein